MNIITTLKTLPVVAAVAIGLVLSPAVSMADKADSGHQKSQYSHEGGKSHGKAHKKGNYRSDKARHKKQHKVTRSYDKRGNKHVSKKHYGKPYGFRKGHAYNRHGHRDNHRHGHRGHSHTHYVVNDDYDYYDHYLDLDNLRFMIGLHTNNFDIILRE